MSAVASIEHDRSAGSKERRGVELEVVAAEILGEIEFSHLTGHDVDGDIAGRTLLRAGVEGAVVIDDTGMAKDTAACRNSLTDRYIDSAAGAAAAAGIDVMTGGVQSIEDEVAGVQRNIDRACRT